MAKTPQVEPDWDYTIAGIKRKEPKYLKNICPTCHEPMLGAHFHDSRIEGEEA